MHKKVIKIVSIISIIILILLLIIFYKINTNKAFKIYKVISKTLDIENFDYKLQYTKNENTKELTGNIDNNFKERKFNIKVKFNKRDFKLLLTKEKSILYYKLKILNKWIPVDITDIVSKYFSNDNKINIKTILKAFKVDEIIDLKFYPEDLNLKMYLKLLDDNFVKNILGIDSSKYGEESIYGIKPKFYELLEEILKCSNLTQNEKEEEIKKLKLHEKELKELDSKLIIKTNKNIIINVEYYNIINNENDIKVKLNLD